MGAPGAGRVPARSGSPAPSPRRTAVATESIAAVALQSAPRPAKPVHAPPAEARECPVPLEASDASAPAPVQPPFLDKAKSCRACGGRNGPVARFCQFCGSPFDGSSGERPRSVPPSPAPSTNGELQPAAELVIIAQDGSPGRRFPLEGNDILIGSAENSGVLLRKDPYVNPLHARISYRSGSFFIQDAGSINGVFVRLAGAVALRNDDRILLGLCVMKFETLPESERNLEPAIVGGTRVFGTPPTPRYARLTVMTVEDRPRDVYYLSRAETVLGRELGDVVFTDDPFMSRRHAALRRDPTTNHFTLRDLGSSNGTFLAIKESHVLSHGDHVRIGQHLFRLDVRRSG